MRLIFALLMSSAFAVPASAQLSLHGGAEAPATPTSGAKLGEGEAPAHPAKAKPIPMKPPSEDSVVGRDLRLNGAKGWLALARQGQDLSLTRLALDGEDISQTGEPCHIDINAGLPVTLHFEGRPQGAARYHVDLPACPFSFDVLEGAVFVPAGQACTFKEADCRADPAGLWGPQGNAIAPAKVKEMEHARVRIESDMRANFRVLLQHAGKDRVAVKRTAAEQAGFSSERETLCRSYALESQNGFCALEITRARVLALLAKLDAEGPEEESKKQAKKHSKPMAKVRPSAAPAGASPSEPAEN